MVYHILNSSGHTKYVPVYLVYNIASHLRPNTTQGILFYLFLSGTNGVATFIFDEPSVFDSSGELGDITGFYMIDEEGVIQTVDVSAKFVNGKPARIEAKYIMRTPQEWDRFMRFMERYSNANSLQFVKK